jgi:hypothetical protein
VRRAVAALVLLAIGTAGGCRCTKDGTPTHAVELPKLKVHVTDGGKALAVSGPYGPFDVALDPPLGPVGPDAMLSSIPEGDVFALAAAPDKPWTIFYLVPKRKGLTVEGEVPAGAIASKTRTIPAGPIDWNDTPSLVDVAGDIVRETHPGAGSGFQVDVLGAVGRLGYAPVAITLAKARDVVANPPFDAAGVREEICTGKSAWMKAFKRLPDQSRTTLVAGLMEELRTSKLHPERVLRTAIAAPFTQHEVAIDIEVRIRELDGESDPALAPTVDAARAILLRRLIPIAAKPTAELACGILSTSTHVGPKTREAAMLALARAEHRCWAVKDLVKEQKHLDEDTAVAILKEPDEPHETMLKRVAGDCGVPTNAPADYDALARAVLMTSSP